MREALLPLHLFVLNYTQDAPLGISLTTTEKERKRNGTIAKFHHAIYAITIQGQLRHKHTHTPHSRPSTHDTTPHFILTSSCLCLYTDNSTVVLGLMRREWESKRMAISILPIDRGAWLLLKIETSISRRLPWLSCQPLLASLSPCEHGTGPLLQSSRRLSIHTQTSQD